MANHLVNKRTPSTLPLVLLTGAAALSSWLEKQPKATRNWVSSIGFRAAVGATCLIPGKDGSLARVLVGVPKQHDTWALSKLPSSLPKGRYAIESPLDPTEANDLALGWSLGTYRFDRYKPSKREFSDLVWPESADRAWVSAFARAIGLGRDLINTPAEDLGPEQLGAAARALAEEFSGKYQEIVGDRLLAQNYPAIHAVGRASARAPRLLDFTWGNPKHPKVTLVGKGVCFDSGGLDLKPAEAMKLMKKDMGGAATVLAVAAVVMQLELPIRLRVLIPAVENSVSGNAFRPLDVLQTRKGLTVEVGHTDAEGRLILADALTEACREKPQLVIDVATLTGAARVALGTSLPALFTTHRALASELLAAGETQQDPLWQLPLFDDYKSLLDSKVAHLSNVAAGPYAGAITAALFLREFVEKDVPWLHVDTMAYHLTTSPGRPQGGEVFGTRAIVEMLRRRYRKP